MKRTLLLAGRCGSTATALPSCTRVCRTTAAAWRVPTRAAFQSVRSTATAHGSPQQQQGAATGGSTVDEEEVQRLSESARLRWWDPEGEMKPLHRMNPKRVAYLRTCLTKRLGLPPLAPQPFTGLRFLDVGCGPGLLTESLARLGGEVLGVDASAANIQTAIKHSSGDSSLSTLAYRHGTAEGLAAEGQQFDVVSSLEVIEHVNNPELFINSLSGLVKPGGSLFLSTINRTMKSYALAIVGAEYILGWVPPGTHQWNKFVQPTELGVLLQRAGMNLEELTGLAYQPWNGSWSFTTDTSVNYLLWATKPLAQ